MKATRIYTVTRGQAQGHHTRLVRAGHPAQALSHVTHSDTVVRVASQEELVKLMQDGVQVESASPDGGATAALPGFDDSKEKE